MDMNPSDADRYQDKAFLRLLECYVLQAIGELPPEDAVTLSEMEPTLRESLDQEGSWSEILEATLEMPEGTPALIAEIWSSNREIAMGQGIIITPQQFAQMFVDETFAP